MKMSSSTLWENMTLWEIFISIVVLELKVIFVGFFFYSLFRSPKQTFQHMKLYITQPYRLMVYIFTGKDKAKENFYPKIEKGETTVILDNGVKATYKDGRIFYTLPSQFCSDQKTTETTVIQAHKEVKELRKINGA